MSRRALACGTLLAAALSERALVAQSQVFRASVDTVIVDVDVRQNGHPVSDLTAGDFELLDNGVKQRIDVTSLSRAPIDVTLVIDASGSVDGKRLGQLKAALRDTVKWLKPDDTWRVLAVGHVLKEIVRPQPPGSTEMVDALQASGGTALNDGLAAALIRPADPNRRRLVIAYTDGNDTSSILDSASLFDVAARFDSVVDVVAPGNPSNQPAGPIDQGPRASLGGQVGSADGLIDRTTSTAVRLGVTQTQGEQDSGLTELTRRTGGRIVGLDNPDAIGATFHRLLDDYRTEYILWYARTGVPAEGWHDLVVRVTRHTLGHVEVRARPGYWG